MSRYFENELLFVYFDCYTITYICYARIANNYTASAERSFQKLKTIKYYLQTIMAQERLSDLSIMSIENEIWITVIE